MSKPIWVISSDGITKEEVQKAIIQAGGVLTPERPYLGRVSHDMSHVWIYPPYENDLTNSDWEEEDIVMLRKLFGNEPKSVITVDISFHPGSQKQAVAFAILCTQHWLCVVENLHGKFFTKEEIIQLEQEGGGFSSYGL